MQSRSLLALALALAALLRAGEARAYEDQVEIAGAFGYAGRLAGADDFQGPDHGFGFSGTLGFGLNDAWSLRATGLGQVFVPEPRFRRSALLFETTYALDVVRVVPVLGVGVGAALEGHRGVREFAPAFSAFVGLDVLVTRAFLLGPELRLLAVPFGGIDGSGGISLSASLRLAYLWDRF